MPWHVYAAAVTGPSHEQAGLPCQDAFSHRIDGDVLCAAVCDGAGSAARSDLGAERIADGVVQRLGRRVLFGEPLWGAPRDVFEAAVRDVIAEVRKELESMAFVHGEALSAFAATLVGVVASPHGGWLFHIGDGLGVAEPAVGHATFSLPENGEYANETYFVTGDGWRDHVRCTPIESRPNHVVLMSDGAAPFVMEKGHTGLFRPFFDPVIRYLGGASIDEGRKALASTLADPRTHAITADDKTLLIAQWR